MTRARLPAEAYLYSIAQVDSRVWGHSVRFLALMNQVCLIWQLNRMDVKSRNAVDAGLDFLNAVFAVCYVSEMVVKMVAYGVVGNENA